MSVILTKEVLIGIGVGILIGLPQGFSDLPNFPEPPIVPDTLYLIAGFGFIGGFLIGVHLLSRANPSPRRHVAYAFLLAFTFSIGIPNIVRHFNGHLIESTSMSAAFFVSIGLAMLIGGMLSGIASRNT